MAEMQAFSDSPYLRLNMDTGNTFIAGRDPGEFLRRFLKKVSHVHVKDVSESLAKAVRGGLTGIAVSHCSLGEGVNAGNIRQCLTILRDAGSGGAEHGVRGPERPDDREIPRLAATDLD
jgi:sugar phosphate isomerase/epimerase